MPESGVQDPDQGSRLASEECDLLLSGGVVLTQDDERRVIRRGAVAVAGERILAVGAVEDVRMEAKRTIDCAGKAVIPGFIDCHTHLFNSLGRGLGDGLSLWPWLRDFKWPYNSAMSRTNLLPAVLLSVIEAASSGITSLLDHHYAPTDLESTLAVADAIEEVGLRGVVARGLLGQASEVAGDKGLATPAMFRYSVQAELDITRAAITQRPPGGRVAVWPGPVNLTYADQELIRRAAELAGELGTGWHTHSSETRMDVETYLRLYGVRPLEFLDREGLLDSRSTIAHGVWLSDEEVDLAGANRVRISHNPVSNQYLASGVIRLRDLRSAGSVVGLGTDGAVCGHRQDMFEQMKHAILMQRVATLDATAFSGQEAFDLATREGAQYLGLDVGMLASGKLADIVVVDLDRPHLVPMHDPVATLVYAARGSDVVMTIVGGEMIFEQGLCSRVDVAQILGEAKTQAIELIKAMGTS